jgi:hypothetical protein
MIVVIVQYVSKIRTANESSSSELGLAQPTLMKIWLESSWAHETLQAEKSSSNSAH